VSVALCTPTKPLPSLIALISAARCASLRASSPLVSANMTTSVSDRPAALMRLRSSVAVTEKLLALASAFITSRAAAIESCLKPAVAVSIRTRSAGVPGAGVATVGAVGVDDTCLHAQAATTTTISHA
jgi:hypothetical protein